MVDLSKTVSLIWETRDDSMTISLMVKNMDHKAWKVLLEVVRLSEPINNAPANTPLTGG